MKQCIEFIEALTSAGYREHAADIPTNLFFQKCISDANDDKKYYINVNITIAHHLSYWANVQFTNANPCVDISLHLQEEHLSPEFLQTYFDKLFEVLGEPYYEKET